MSTSSKRWLKEHFEDVYVKKAKEKGYPSRAAYKLLEIQEKYNFIKQGMWVIDLGAAPGGWSMIAKEFVGDVGKVFALDCLPMQEITGVEFIQGDFTQQATLDALLDKIGSKNIDLVLSDMAPNLSGCKEIDQPKIMYLAELAWSLAQQVLSPNGFFLIKIFQGAEVDLFVKILRKHFKKVVYSKPKASRSRSAEIYILASNFIRL